MALNCRIEGGKVFAPNGKESKLYKTLKDTFGESKAMDYYALTENSDYQPIDNIDNNGEMDINSFMQYASSKKSIKDFTQETLDLQFRDFNIKELNTLYTNGIFNPSKSSLERVGNFTKDEIETILSSEEIQNTLKNFIDNLSLNEVEPIDNPQKKKEYNSIGIRPIENPSKTEEYILEKTFRANTIDQVDEFVETLEDKDIVNKYKTDPEYRDYIRELSLNAQELPIEYVGGETLEKLLKTLDVTKLDEVNQAASEILINEDKGIVLDEFDNLIDSFANAGLDINLDKLDYQNKPLDWFKDFVRNTLEFSTNLDIEKAEAFASFLDSIIEKPTKKVVTVSTDQNVNTLKILDTTLNEVEVFEKMSFIKQGDKIYQKVKQYSLEDMYSIFYDIVKENPSLTGMQEDFDMDSIESYVRDRMNEFPEASSETLEKLIIFKTVFKSPFETTLANDIVTEKKNEEYLKEDFVSDFSKEYIKNKIENTELYNNFYQFLEITDKGIRPINNTKYTETHILNNAPKNVKNNLINYFSLSKNTTFVTEQVEAPIEGRPRLNAIQNPLTVEKITTDYQIINENEIVSKQSKDFLRVRNDVYEAVISNGESTLYSKITDSNTEFYKTSAEKPTTEMTLEELSRFDKNKDNTVSYKKHLSKQDIEEINEKEFNCKK